MIERLETKTGLYYYIVKAGNGAVLAKSVEYHSKAARENGIESLKKYITLIIANEN